MATIHPAVQGTQAIRLWRSGILAALVAALGNTMVYVAGQRLGTLSDHVLIPATGQSLTLAPVLLASTVPIIAATALLGLLYRYAPRSRATFITIAIAVLALSCASPFSLPTADGPFIATLLFMHLIAAFAGAGILVALNRR